MLTDQGEVLKRGRVSRETPEGINWLSIEQPSNCGGLKQIGLGKSSVWALDNQGSVFYRAGITDKSAEGVKWVLIAAQMLNISVSAADQLWAINANDNALYIRFGIDEENMSGISWKKVNLKFKKVQRTSQSPEDEMRFSNLALIDSNASLAPGKYTNDHLLVFNFCWFTGP